MESHIILGITNNVALADNCISGITGYVVIPKNSII